MRSHYRIDVIQSDMRRRGWLPTDLAQAAHVSLPTITRFLNGDVQTARTAKKIAGAFKRSIERYLKE